MLHSTRKDRENASRAMNLRGVSLSFLSIKCRSWPAIKHKTNNGMEILYTNLQILWNKAFPVYDDFSEGYTIGVHGFYVYPSSCTVHEHGYTTYEC